MSHAAAAYDPACDHTLERGDTSEADLDEELRRMRLYALRNRVLKGLLSLVVGWGGLTVLSILGLTAFDPFGASGTFGLVVPVLFLGNLVMSVGLLVLVVFAGTHLALNERLTLLGKLGWVAATWFFGFPLLIYFNAHVFSETGSDLDDPIGY